MFLKFLRVAIVALVAAGYSETLSAAGDTDEQQRLAAVDNGVKYLVGVLDRGKLGGRGRTYRRCNDYAIAGLSLLCHGSGREEGPYHDRHLKLLDYMKKHRFAGKQRGSYYLGVWGHGYMLWYVSELADTAAPENRHEIDRLAVQLIKELSSWQAQSGGWGHHPQLVPTDSGYREFSVITSLSLSSLLRARERGYYVNSKVIDRAFQYLDSTIKGQSGAPRYAASANIGAGNQREGAPRGALVMLPYALDGRTTPAIRRLLGYLQNCKDFTGGHGSAALGMCHSALLFATIDEYDYFWKLHGQSIMQRQKNDGSFEPLPPGERMDQERANDLSNAFHTLTLALPEAPWKWRQKTLPDTSYYSARAVIDRAQTLVDKGNTYPSIQKLAELDPEASPAALARRITSFLRGGLRDSKQDNDSQWLASILDPHASLQLISQDGKDIKLQLAVSPLILRGVQAEAKIVLEGKDQVLRKTNIRPQTTAMSTKPITLRASDVGSTDDLRVKIDWVWSGRTFTTTHTLLTPYEEDED